MQPSLVPAALRFRFFLFLIGASAALGVALAGASRLNAQEYAGRPCETGNPRLAAFLRGEDAELSLNDGVTGDFAAWSTSFLNAEGQPPERPEDYDVELDGNSDVHHWTCMYAASRAFDRNQDTAWSEGVDGPGIGEALVVKVEDPRRPIQILPGFARSERLFRRNNRPERIRIYVLESRRPAATQMGIFFADLQILAKAEFTLEDKREWQTLRLPEHAEKYSAPEHGRGLIAIEILSVYKGSHYDDTLISEVMNAPEQE